MRSLLIPILLIAATSANAQSHQWAVIDDSDHSTVIRQSPSAKAPVTDSIWENQFFVVEKKRGEWWQIWHKSIAPAGSGYIHKSRVRLINELPDTASKRLLYKIFNGYHLLLSLQFINYSDRDKHPEKFTTADKKFLDETNQIIAETNEYSIDPALRYVPRYLCRTADSSVLNYFFMVVASDTISNSIAPSEALGECFICQPEWFAKQLRALPEKERDIVFKQTQTGLKNNIDIAADKRAALSEMLKVEMLRE